VTDAHTSAGLATRPDPPKDRDSQPVPDRIAPILQIALILAEYGRHLAATIEHRALWRGFATIAQFFGTATAAVILPHIHRGIMRAMALEHMLLERAKRGRDLVIPAPRVRASCPAQSPAVPQSEPAAAPQPAEAPSAREPKPPLARRTSPEEPLTFDNMPSMEALEKEVRRRPIGRTIADICRDLGVSPGLCLGPFWTMLFEAIHFYRGSVTNLVRDMRRREKQLDRESWKHPNLGFPEEKREGVQRVLGFFIGEPPVDPFRPLSAPGVPPTAAATGPPSGS
jgi:hypothetical protein